MSEQEHGQMTAERAIELLTRRDMLKQFADDYDGEDLTNALSWAEYFEEVRT